MSPCFAILAQKAFFCKAVSTLRVPSLLGLRGRSGQGAGDFLGGHGRSKHRSRGLSAAAFRLQSQHLKRAASAQPLLGCYKPHPPALKQLLFRGYVHHRTAPLWKDHPQPMCLCLLCLCLIVVRTVSSIFQLKQMQFLSCQLGTEALQCLQCCSSCRGLLAGNITQLLCAALAPADTSLALVLNHMNFSRGKKKNPEKLIITAIILCLALKAKGGDSRRAPF